MFFSFRYFDIYATGKQRVTQFLVPFQTGVNTAGYKLAKQFDIFRDTAALARENEKLEQDLVALRLISSTLTSDLRELDELRKLYKLGAGYSQYPQVAARIISKEPGMYYRVFTIDKGTDDGLRVDMNVLAGGGLCGIIYEAGKNYAKVRAIIDDTSYVSAMFATTSDTCDVKGDVKLLESGYLRVSGIPIDTKVQTNAEVVTSHVSDKYLPGILIGYISDLETDSDDMSKRGLLTPVVDFMHLEVVIVIVRTRDPMQAADDEDVYREVLRKAQTLSPEYKQQLKEALTNNE
jgi:rod shape-determining protein MreC